MPNKRDGQNTAFRWNRMKQSLAVGRTVNKYKSTHKEHEPVKSLYIHICKFALEKPVHIEGAEMLEMSVSIMDLKPNAGLVFSAVL